MSVKLSYQRAFLLKRGVVLLFVAILTAATALTVRFNIKGHFEGIFLLKGTGWYQLELKDDLYIGDGHRLIWALDFDDPYYRIRHLFARNHKDQGSHLTYEWMARDGKGYVKSLLPGGKMLVTYFSRFEEDEGESKGLLVGGGLPQDVADETGPGMNKTGMTYFDGHRWFHIWCTVNEALFSQETLKPIYSSEWKFLDSKVLNESDRNVTIWSRHIITVDQVPLQMDRIAYFTAGEPYFLLTVKITNLSKRFAHYIYSYGDEPWLGNYGTSGGNIGWVQDHLIHYTGPVDSSKFHWAGMYDYGNDLLGEGHNFTGLASFLQWQSEGDPTVYFANSETETASTRHGMPLSGNSRFVGVEFVKTNMLPGESAEYRFAIGMAGVDAKRGIPVKPVTPLDGKEQ